MFLPFSLLPYSPFISLAFSLLRFHPRDSIFSFVAAVAIYSTFISICTDLHSSTSVFCRKSLANAFSPQLGDLEPIGRWLK